MGGTFGCEPRQCVRVYRPRVIPLRPALAPVSVTPVLTPTDFASLSLRPALFDNLASLDYREMTPVQAQSLPAVLARRDVLAQARTGSGKTAAFGLGLLQQLDTKRFRVQSLVLCPTRELADQVASEIRKLARGLENTKVLTLCGGAPMGPQLGALEHGVHIVVGTPGRVEKHLNKGSLSLDALTGLVLDEADRMLDMGFEESINAILSFVPTRRQTLLFSATFPDHIEAMAGRILVDPVRVVVGETHDAASIEQFFFRIDKSVSRGDAVQRLLLQYRPASAVVFCITKQETRDLCEALRGHGFGALALHGDLDQRERDHTMIRFSNKSANVLVATDVAARGLDIDALDAVISAHFPRDFDDHTHRVGRTGRAGNKGIACTLYTDKDTPRLAQLEAHLGQPLVSLPLPDQRVINQPVDVPLMSTLQIDGGKKQKIRVGDILGALTGDGGIDGSCVGKIQVFDIRAYVAVERAVARMALNALRNGKIKGRSFKARLLPT